jgi:hypothetical protein
MTDKQRGLYANHPRVLSDGQVRTVEFPFLCSTHIRACNTQAKVFTKGANSGISKPTPQQPVLGMRESQELVTNIFNKSRESGPMEVKAFRSLITKALPKSGDVTKVAGAKSKPITVQRLPNAEKASHLVSGVERTRRNKVLQQTLLMTSCPADADSDVQDAGTKRQMKSFLTSHKTLFQSEIDALASKALFRFSFEQTIALEAATNMPESMRETFNRAFKATFGYSLFHSAKKQREFNRSLEHQSTLYSKSVTIPEGDRSGTYDVYYWTLDNPILVVKEHLRKLQEQGLLAWEHGMKLDEIHWKLMGDKGGDYTTLILCCSNIVGRHSPKNSIVLGMYTGAPETYESTSVAFGSIISAVLSLDGKQDLILPALPSKLPLLPTFQAQECLFCKTNNQSTVQLQCCCPGSNYVHVGCLENWATTQAENGVPPAEQLCFICKNAETYQWQCKSLGIVFPAANQSPIVQEGLAKPNEPPGQLPRRKPRRKRGGEPADDSNLDSGDDTDNDSDSAGRGEELYDDLETYAQLFCVCKQPWVEGTLMVGCDKCPDWFHPGCVGLSGLTKADLKKTTFKFTCAPCESGGSAALPQQPGRADGTLGVVCLSPDDDGNQFDNANKAYSDRCPHCHFCGPAPPRFVRQPLGSPINRFRVAAAGDMPWLLALMGISGPNSVYFCPYSWCSRRCRVPGKPHVGDYIFTIEQQLEWMAAVDQHKRENSNKKTYEALTTKAEPKTITQLNTLHQLVIEGAEQGKTWKDVKCKNVKFQPLLPPDFDPNERMAPMTLHLNLGLVSDQIKLIAMLCFKMDVEIKELFLVVDDAYSETEPLIESCGEQPIAPRVVLLGWVG